MGARNLLQRIPGWLVLAAIVLIAGFVTFAVGGTPGSQETETRLDLMADPAGVVSVETVLELTWGEDDDQVWVAEDPDRSTIEAVFASADGRVALVDRPSWHQGSRVRWFAADGTVSREHLAPVGSTLFSADGDGLLYVLAKSGGPSETVVEVGADGAVEATYTVPLGINTGGVMRIDGEIMVAGTSSVADLENATLNIVEYLLPVTVGGRQATDQEAEEGIVDAWLVSAQGAQYERMMDQAGFGEDAAIRQTVGSGQDVLEIPPRAAALGVDGAGRLVGMIEADSSLPARRATAGRPALDRSAELFWASLDGTLEGVAALAPSATLANARQPVFVGTDAVYLLAGGPQGVRVLTLRVTP